MTICWSHDEDQKRVVTPIGSKFTRVITVISKQRGLLRGLIYTRVLTLAARVWERKQVTFEVSSLLPPSVSLLKRVR